MSVLLKKNFFYTNHKSKNGKFLWFDKIFVPYCFASFMTLNTKTGCFCALIKFIRHLFLVILLGLWLQKPKQQVSMT